jgi:hypothetical protein
MFNGNQIISDVAEVANVLESMETPIQPQTPTPEPATTPRTLRSTRRIVEDIRSRHIYLSPTIQQHLKGSLYLAEKLAITTTQLHQV